MKNNTTPDTNSGETPTPRTDAVGAWMKKEGLDIPGTLFCLALQLERELSRPVAPVTGLPDGCPETLMFPVGPHAKGNPHIECPDCRGTCTPVEILPVGSRERLGALEAALEDAATALDAIGKHASAEKARALIPAKVTLCLCGHALEEHTPEIGCTEFRHQEKK